VRKGRIVGDSGGADRHGVRDEPDAVGLLEEAGSDLAEGDARSGLAGGGALEDRAGVVEGVLLHPDEIGVTGARSSERAVAGDLLLGVDVVRRGIRLVGDRVGAHDGLPLGPFAVGDADRNR